MKNYYPSTWFNLTRVEIYQGTLDFKYEYINRLCWSCILISKRYQTVLQAGWPHL